ncbi:TPA: glycoside hydrolase family protein [Pseudomonas aeruginosa]
MRKLNAGDVRGACAELSRWVYAGGKKLGGLVRRRAAERELCEIGL